MVFLIETPKIDFVFWKSITSNETRIRFNQLQSIPTFDLITKSKRVSCSLSRATASGVKYFPSCWNFSFFLSHLWLNTPPYRTLTILKWCEISCGMGNTLCGGCLWYTSQNDYWANRACFYRKFAIGNIVFFLQHMLNKYNMEY